MELTREYFEEYLEQKLSQFQDHIDLQLSQFPTRQEFKTLEVKIDDIQQKVTRIDTRTDEDTRAALKDLAKLQRRVTALERALKLQPE